MTTARPLPDITDVDYAPFWAAAADDRLVVQRCGACGDHRWPPRPLCPLCQSPSIEWTDVTGVGTVYSWTRIAHPYLAAFVDRVPYVVGVVELDDPAVRILGTLMSDSPDDIGIGTRCAVEFEEISDGIRVPVWRVGEPGARQ